MFEVLILAAIALFVLQRLYVALGRDDGPPEGQTRAKPQRPVAVPNPVPNLDEEPAATFDRAPVFTGEVASDLEDIYKVDPSFSPDEFLRGARGAYELIVGAFADGDRETLRPLLDDDVYEAWDEAIAAREAKAAEPWRLLRIKRYEIEAASLEDTMARVMVRYEAELGDGDNMRTAREIWTFMRDVNANDPNWLLDDVEIAT